jgi:DNA-binding transcriptional MerR regulator
MAHLGMLIGKLAAETGMSRKAIRLYEAHGILPPPARTGTGYRVYGEEVVDLLRFVARARQLGFGLDEIQEIVAIRRKGSAPCEHVRALAERRLAAVEQALRVLGAQQQMLRDLLASWRARRGEAAAVCPHIEDGDRAPKRRKRE